MQAGVVRETQRRRRLIASSAAVTPQQPVEVRREPCVAVTKQRCCPLGLLQWSGHHLSDANLKHLHLRKMQCNVTECT